MTDSIENIVADLHKCAEEFGKDHLLIEGKPVPIDLAFTVYIANRLMAFVDRLVAIPGENKVADLYRGSRHAANPKNDIRDYLLTAISRRRMFTNTPRAVVDWLFVKAELEKLLSVFSKGVVNWRYRILFASLDIRSDLLLSNGVRLVKQQYQSQDLEWLATWHPDSVQQFILQQPYGIEAVVENEGTVAEFEQQVGDHHALLSLENQIAHGFLLAGIQTAPIQFFVDTVLHPFYAPRAPTTFILGAALPLGNGEVTRLLRASEFVSEHLKPDGDSVLSSVFDRFIRGIKQKPVHPNRSDGANWDKLLDYAIALESLFNANSKTEVSYRFKINGSVLLAPSVGISIEKAFDVLGAFYDVRCDIAHGNSQRKFRKGIKALLAALDIPHSDRHSEIEQLRAICEIMEDWIRKIIFYVNDIAREKRPYKEIDGRMQWEQYIWGYKTATKSEPRSAVAIARQANRIHRLAQSKLRRSHSQNVRRNIG